MLKSMDYSIVIPAFNEEKLIGRTLEQLSAVVRSLLDKFKGEIIVVDNNSTDSTAAMASSYGVKVIFEEINCIAVARNAGASAAKGRFLIFIDADTLAGEQLVRTALENMSGGKICGGGAGVVFEGSPIPLIGKIMIVLWRAAVKIYPMAAGSFIYCLRDAWKETGGFDETLYASEELYFSRAIRKWGKKRGMSFKIVEIPAFTSARKFEWYSTYGILFNMIFFMLFPFALRQRRFCGFWYKRK